MKLAAHYSKASIIISVSVLLISGVIYYLIINHIARQQLDNDLADELVELVEYVNTNHSFPISDKEDQLSYAKTNLQVYDTRFFDAPFLNEKENENEAGRAVTALIKIKDQNYIATIVESREDTEYLIQIISSITIILTAVLLSVLIITNRYVLNGLWRPFHYILGQVKNFNIANANGINAVEGKVDEFNELSDAVAKMSSRVTSDYQGLKTFTENASHEMMTPLAVITSKLDLLIQDETLRSDQLSQITDIYSASSRLARLNQSLLLLVKIDNNLMPETELLNIQTIIFEKAQQFQELIHNKKIELELTLNYLEISASKYLMDVLVNNLFSNAIRHNETGGIIRITINHKKLLFQNTGEQTPLMDSVVFERFYKGKTSDGTGLGLAIMKNICNLYGFELVYQYINGLHSFEITFERKDK
jgi:signal transduction histidine kinase